MHAILFVLLAGLAINAHNYNTVHPDNTIDGFGKARDLIVESVEEGYGRDSFVSHKLND